MPTSVPVRGGWLLVFAVSATGCVALPRVPTTPSEDPNFSPPTRVEQPGVDEAADAAEPLRLMPGDVLAVHTFSAENNEYPGLIVDEQGDVQVPLAGSVRVGGLTLPEAERRIEEQISRFDRIARVSVVIGEATGHQATVLGAVSDPGRKVITPGTRLADLVAMAGGPMIEETSGEAVVLAELDGARLVRQGSTVPVSVMKALEGDPRHNIRIRPGDHLYVPPARGSAITVLGEVSSPQIVAFRAGIRLTQVLAIASGLTSEGDRADIHIVRGPLREPRVYRASLRAVVNGRATDVELAPGDIVYVTQEWTANVGEVLARLAPIFTTATTAWVTYLIWTGR